MSPGWLRHGASRERSPSSRSERMHADGCPVVLQQLDTAQPGDKVIEALRKRYEIEALDQAQLLFRVVVDDARFPDEAVVRLAGVLDEIETDWPERFAWPKAQCASL